MLSHKFGRVLAENEVDDLMIAQFMGHNSVDSSRIYTELFAWHCRKSTAE